MEFVIEKNQLLKSLGIIQGVCGRKLVVPVLAMVYIEASQDGTVSFQGTDMEIWLKTTVKADVTSPGVAMVSAKKFYEIVKLFPEMPVTMKLSDSNRLNVRCGKSYFRLLGTEEVEFPKVVEPTCQFFEVSSKLFKDLIDKTSFAASDEAYKFNINGVFVVSEDGLLRMVATDGKQLALVEKEGNIPDLAGGCLIPKSGLQEVAKNIEGDKLQIGFVLGGENQSPYVYFKSGGLMIAVRLPSDIEFPNYKKIIPSGEIVPIVVGKTALYEPMQRVGTLTSDKQESIMATLQPGLLRSEAKDKDFGEGADETEVNYSGEEIVLGINVGHFLEILNHIEGDKVSVLILGTKKPVVIMPEKEKNQIYVIMPMKI